MRTETLPELKTLAPIIEIKEVGKAGEFSGYGSVFGVKDGHNDIVAQGAFMESLAKHKAAGTWPALLWNHDPSSPIGEWTELREDSRGLFVKGKLWIEGSSPDQDALKAYRSMKAANGRLGLSIGFRTLDYSLDRTTGVRTLTKCDLWEVSAVTFPSNADARVLSAKSLPGPGDVEKILRDAGFSRAEAKVLVSGGYKAVRLRDADEDAARHQLAQDIRSGAAAIRSLMKA